MATKRVADPKTRSKSSKKRKRERPIKPRIDYEEIEKENKLFEEYYTQQCTISSSEWDHFMATVRLPLPATFRLTCNTRVCEDLAECLTQRYIQNFPKLSTNNEPISPPIPIPWYPRGLAWHVDITKKEIRNDPILASYHAFLMRETEIGYISRQEAVSMIPPLFLDIQSHHRVLDMCAAPGSKTTQIIEAMHQSHTESQLQPSESADSPPSPLPTGFVVANDSHNKRSYLLVHQAKRKKSANVIITNHDGTTFPNLYLSKEDQHTGTHVKYDRVLCDVPCSGDGTIRKNPTVWMKWGPYKGNGLHRLQLRLVVRGAELLVDGGRFVYSTCSMNPIENEAVVHTLLKLGEGSLQLVDVSTSLPELEKRAGLKTWKVMSNANKWVAKEGTSESLDGVYSTFFPPPSGGDSYGLERCMRVYPHHQNTGGFFIAVIQKVGPLPWLKPDKNRDSQTEIPSQVEEEKPVTTCDSVKEKEGQETQKIENRPFGVFGRFSTSSGYKGYKGYKEDPFIFMKSSDEMIAELSSLYGLSEDFPWSHCFTRSEGSAKNNIYITTSLISKILATNQANNNAVKIINTGLRVFCRSDLSVGSPSRLRFSQDGCNIFFGYISKRKVVISESDAIQLLENESISLSKLSPQGLEEIKDIPIGPTVFICNPSADSTQPTTTPSEITSPVESDTASKALVKQHKCFITSPLIFSGWRANWSARLFVTKEEKQHYQVMLGYDLISDIDLEAKKKSRFVKCQSRAATDTATPPEPPLSGNDNEKQGPPSEENDL